MKVIISDVGGEKGGRVKVYAFVIWIKCDLNGN